MIKSRIGLTLLSMSMLMGDFNSPNYVKHKIKFNPEAFKNDNKLKLSKKQRKKLGLK